MVHDYSSQCARNLSVFILLFTIILVTYSNTFHASWHFDDFANITQNHRLKINSLNLKSLYKTLFAHPEYKGINDDDKLYRPLPCLTFAINWYFGKDSVIGYHIVNIAIHILTSFFLFLVMFSLFKTPRLKDKYEKDVYFIALLSTTIWALHPIQTQSVTYIVQRMAEMAAMFYIIGIFLYLKGRLNTSRIKKVAYFTSCCLSYIFAFSSKQNAITLPLALFFIEIAFFKNNALSKGKREVKYAFTLIGILVVLIGFGLIFLMKDDPLTFLNDYEHRPFSLYERLLTEPRILTFYLIQLMYPINTILSFHHDVTISSSLFSPWTTFPAIILIFFLVGFGVSQLRKNPILGFSICFYFLNHLIESTIIPLELIFEHRNYLPSLFLFLPFSLGLRNLLNYYREKKHYIYVALVCFIPLLLMGIGMGTYNRNMVWSSEKTLWEDAHAKAPNSHRPLHNLAWGYYERIGDFENAKKYYKKALQKKSLIIKSIHAKTLRNLSIIYYNEGDYKKALESLNSALSIYPGYQSAVRSMVLSLIKLERWEEAEFYVDSLLEKHSIDSNYLNMKGAIKLKQKNTKEAIFYFREALKNQPSFGEALINVGIALSQTGDYEKAQRYLTQARQTLSNDISLYFALIENNVRARNHVQIDKYTKVLLDLFKLSTIEKYIKNHIKENNLNPISINLVAPAIAKAVKRFSVEFVSSIDTKALKRKNLLNAEKIKD